MGANSRLFCLTLDTIKAIITSELGSFDGLLASIKARDAQSAGRDYPGGDVGCFGIISPGC